jgi:hypothetical protein
LNLVAVLMIRVWNPTREARPREEHDWAAQPTWAGDSGSASGDATRLPHRDVGPPTPAKSSGPVREVWDNPILWRELRTWAYGRKVLVIRAAYFLLFAVATAVLYTVATPVGARTVPEARSLVAAEAMPLVPLLVVSLVLVNALAVTSLTTERDGRAVDLLLVTDLTPKEFVFGKLGGVLYNSKEMIVLPALLCCYLWYSRRISGENLTYLLGGFVVMTLFVAVLGIHAGMMYENSRRAIGVSLGTVLFLFLGVATCLRMMIAFSGSFQIQLQPFFAFMLGGGVGLYVSLGSRNPSPAIGLASFLAPFATFYVITSFLIGYPLASFLVTVVTYGFATAAMLVPALYEFDLATGRTTTQ